MNQSPFLGVYRNMAGELIDMFSGQAVTLDQIIPKMSPFFGVFLDAQGNLHDISELGGGGGAATTAAQVSFNNADTPLSATSVQAALVELVNTELAKRIPKTAIVHDTGDSEAEVMSQKGVTDAIAAAAISPATVFNEAFTNATFSGEVNAIAVDLCDNVTVVSFWGFALQDATGTAGQEFTILNPTEYPLLERFIGQVDQFAIGYNAATNDFKYVPIKITSEGMYIVTAPNISIGTRFSYQFVLLLVEPSEE